MPLFVESDLRELGRAKMESDRKNYAAKHEIVRRLISNSPQSFTVDSQQGNIGGITHTPTMFRLHMPMSAVPVEIRPPSSVSTPGEVTPAPKLGAFNMPGHVVSTALGGLLGAGIGYGTGAFIESSLPEGTFRDNTLRKRMALLGGLAGTGPGLWAAHRDGRLNSEDGKSYWGGFFGRDRLMGPEAAAPPPVPVANLKEARAGLQECFAIDPIEVEMSKEADAFFDPFIHVDQFNRAVVEDPFSPLPLKLTTMQIVDQAQQERRSPIVSPFDIARVAIGMGSGLAAGTTLGKVVGVLAGVSPEAQTQLQQAGMWYGALRGALY